MELHKFKFWVNLTLALGTAYIIIWYIFTPSSNQCQMTFMMEPPRFIPVPVDDIVSDSSLRYPSANIRGHFKKADQYKLFIYSEFGFPQISDVHRDLRDSMPVLFVPGNAGSYQQVRSLASTCIRRQLQSLDAFKFIFYTIDFRGELSGLSGHLIEEQTTFVHKALNQISKLHDSQTKGVILIGHSVGGFIAKVLFTRPNFDTSLVPLVISLASPLTRPYLIFDDKMRELYLQTNNFWGKNNPKRNHTFAISLSGGKTDRLVPSHLSMDPQFDLSLTTGAVKGVWLATDHVCITWCKELMNKLAQMMSAVMDKRQTRLIEDKKIVESIILNELLQTEENLNQNTIRKITPRDWKSMRPNIFVELESYYSAYRGQLYENIIILNTTSAINHGFLIILEHLDALKQDGVFACRDISFGTDKKHVTCIEKTDLMHLNVPVPSRRFEPRKTIFKIKSGEMRPFDYIIFDFISYSNQQANRVPESVFVQRVETSTEQALYIPSLLEYLVESFFFINPYEYKVVTDKNLPLYHLKYRLYNLKHKCQTFTIKYESYNCQDSKHSRGATINFYQDGFLKEAFHQDISSKQDTFVVEAKFSFSPKITSLNHRKGQDFLEFYIDGSCNNKFKLEFHILDLIFDIIQRSLGKILTCATYLAYVSIISGAFSLDEIQQSVTFSLPFLVLRQLIHSATFIFIYVASELTPNFIDWRNIGLGGVLDEFVSFMFVFTLSHGMIAYLKYFIKRLIDLTIIISNAQSTLRRRQVNTQNSEAESSKNGSKNGINSKLHSLKTQKRISADLDWVLICLTVASSFIFSGAVNSLFSALIVIKLGLNLETVRYKENESCSSNKHCPGPREIQNRSQYEFVYEIILSILTLCSLALISNIPAALTRFNSNQLTSFEILLNPTRIESNFIASVFSLILIKFITEKIDTTYIYRQLNDDDDNEGGKFSSWFTKYISRIPLKHSHLITLASIVLIDSNISQINVALATSLTWLNLYLIGLPCELSAKSKTSK